MSEPTKGDELHDVAMAIRYDLTSAQSKITELIRQIAALHLDTPASVRCVCGLKFPGPNTLAEHVYHSHDGPEPPHWADLEKLAAEPPDDDEPELGAAGSVP